jgi:GNAT superfamily N-acetyltransferase
MEIRPAEIGDLPLMAKVGRYFHDIAPYGKFTSYDEIGIQDTFLSAIQGGFLMNAWEGDKLIGMLLGGMGQNYQNPSERIAQCLGVAVVPEARRSKAGKALMDALEQWATENGAAAIMCSGYDKRFLNSMKRRGFEQIEYTVMKKVLPDELSV